MSNDEIIRLIGKIRERYDQVYEPSGNIVRIEVDLLRADIRELYERISLLPAPVAPAVVPQQQHPEPEPREEEPPIRVEAATEAAFIPAREVEAFIAQPVAAEFFEPVVETATEETMAPALAVPEPSPEISSPEPIAEPVLATEIAKEIVPPVLPQTPVQHPATEPSAAVHVHEPAAPVHPALDLFGAPTTTLADKFRDEKRSINEKLHLETSADKSIGTRLRLKITDLRSAIGINDRFIFINELFEGDMRMYDDVLGRLNTCASLREAVEIFDHAREAQGWSGELSSVERLLDFIHRRYA